MSSRVVQVSLVLLMASVLLAIWLAPLPLPRGKGSHLNAHIRLTRESIPTQPLLDPLLSPSLTLAQRVRGVRRPVLFRGDLRQVLQWRASEWSAEYFIRAAAEGRGPKELLIKRSNSTEVKFANLRQDRPYVRMADAAETEKQASGSRWPQQRVFSMPYTSHNVSVSQFFSEVHARNPSSYPYFADGISVLGELVEDVLPLHTLCPHRDLNKCDMSIWIGRAGVTAWPHLDSSDNLFVQLVGRKKFTLAPPDAARCGMGLHPSLHPFYRQAERDLMRSWPETMSAQRFAPRSSFPPDSRDGGSVSCNLTLYESVLEAGDVLYIPSNWFHRVTSLSSPSFSINSWWTAPGFQATADTLQQPLPFQSEWTPRMTRTAAALYVRQLLESVEGMLRRNAPATTPPAGSFLARELLVTRFDGLFDRPLRKEQCDARAKEELGCAPLTSAEEVLSLLPASSRPTDPVHSVSVALEHVRAHFGTYVSRVLSLYDQREVESELARLHVLNLVEEILHYAVQHRVDELYPFLACCVARIGDE